MRDPARIPQVLALMEVMWRKNPDARFGQLVSNTMLFLAPEGTNTNEEIDRFGFYLEDDKLIEGLRDLLGVAPVEHTITVDNLPSSGANEPSTWFGVCSCGKWSIRTSRQYRMNSSFAEHVRTSIND